MRDFWDKLENLVGDFRGYYPNVIGNNPFTFLLAPILGFLILFFLILGNWKSITHWFDRSLASNEIELSSDGDIELAQIQITWKMDYTNEVEIYREGEFLYTDFFERGDNFFSIFYNDSSIAEFVHYKETGLEGHDYKISLKESTDCINVNVKIEGASDSIRWLKKTECVKAF